MRTSVQEGEKVIHEGFSLRLDQRWGNNADQDCFQDLPGCQSKKWRQNNAFLLQLDLDRRRQEGFDCQVRDFLVDALLHHDALDHSRVEQVGPDVRQEQSQENGEHKDDHQQESK